MKTPEEIKKEFLKLSTTEQFEKFVFEIQKEAYNQAIEDAAESATTESVAYSDCGEVDKQSILKLKK